MPKDFLYPAQWKAVQNMHNGCILCGDVGSGKSRTALYYYFSQMGGCYEDKYVPMKEGFRDLYIITTARKRDTLEWEKELNNYFMSCYPECSYYGKSVVVDSWNNIKKYQKVYGAFFIFDEDRVIGSGAWVRSFLNLARKNKWIILSATPGDKWEDYIAVFIANGYYKSQKEFKDRHIVYNPYTKYPKVDHYLEQGLLQRYRKEILVDLEDQRTTERHEEFVEVKYDKHLYQLIFKTRWNFEKDEPIKNPAELQSVVQRAVYSDQSRIAEICKIRNKHHKVIIFYNYDFELEILRNADYGDGVQIREWNGHKHEGLPVGDDWVYLVQYMAGAEGWNCITTDTMIFYSLNPSYRMMEQASGRIDRINTPYHDLYYYKLASFSPLDILRKRALAKKKDFNESRFFSKQWEAMQ